MNQLLADYYRLPDTAVEFSVTESLSEDVGYFKFGDESICFGRCSTGFRAMQVGGHLYDALREVAQAGSTLILPFNPDEVIGNFLYERYADHSHHQAQAAFRNLVRKIYYLIRPALRVSFRKRLQKIHLNGWDEISFPRWPVDRTVDQLMQKLLSVGMQAKGQEKVPFIWFWPDGANACAIMTHDVETRAGQQFCSELMDINQSFGIPASFQIVPEKRYPVSADFVHNLVSRGFEVNVQDLNHDGLLFANRNEFLRRVKKINEYGIKFGARGFRSAVLYRNQDWYQALNFEYDMSVPNVAHLDPQRGGCCTVMPYFIGNILELPVTTTQDYSLMHILNDYSLNLWERQIGLILEEHGLISFIVHPDYIISKKPQDVYRRLLRLLNELRSKRNVWLAYPREVNDWWRNRKQMRITQHGNRWKIEGPGSERARLAFATIENGHAAYSISEPFVKNVGA